MIHNVNLYNVTGICYRLLKAVMVRRCVRDWHDSIPSPRISWRHCNWQVAIQNKQEIEEQKRLQEEQLGFIGSNQEDMLMFAMPALAVASTSETFDDPRTVIEIHKQHMQNVEIVQLIPALLPALKSKAYTRWSSNAAQSDFHGLHGICFKVKEDSVLMYSRSCLPNVDVIGHVNLT